LELRKAGRKGTVIMIHHKHEKRKRRRRREVRVSTLCYNNL
jgi:hypothetical protein